MIKAGVIGHPIAHSKSPIIHGTWIHAYGIDGEYQRYDIAPENLAEGVQELITKGLAGFNVTLPHKQAIIPLCATLSDEARAIGAVNTVIINSDGTLHGHNTDAFGFAQNLNAQIPDFDWTQSPTVVIGAGGAARAILYALHKNGACDIRITNRTRTSADQLATPYNATVFDWDDRSASLQGAGLIINTTSLGMKGQGSLDINLDGMKGSAVVYDIVYVPLMTDLLLQAQQKGARLVTGIGMLLHQARPGFEAWFGHYPDVTADLEQRVLFQ